MREAQGLHRTGEQARPVEVLAGAAQAIHGPLRVEDKLAWVVEAVRDLTGATISAYLDVGSEGGDLTTTAGAQRSDVDRFARPVMARLFTSVREGSAVLRAEDLAKDRRARTFLHHMGLPPTASCLWVPVHATADPNGPGVASAWHGAIIACRPEADAFDHDQEALVVAVATHLGVALDNLATMTRLAELEAMRREVVHQLQEAVRPPMPATAGVELGVHYLPADPGAPTGGDLYDWVVLPDGDVHLAVVDVMGKGVAATKDAVSVTHALRLLVLDGCPIERLVARAGDLANAQSPDMVATVIVARYRPADGTVQLVAGGHPPALIVSRDGKARLVSAPGVAIGWPGAGSSEVITLELERNDALVLYSDGLIEATKDILVGLDGLTAAATQTAQYPAPHLARSLVERALSGAQRRDDSLALVLRRRVAPLQEALVRLGPFEYRFSPNAATIPLGRHLFGDWLEHLGVDEDEASDLLLVASELCSNAVRHASGAPGALTLRAWPEGDAVVIEVEDDGAGFELDAYYDDELPELESEEGRGLFVVDALTDVMSVRREGANNVVRAVRRAVLPEE